MDKRERKSCIACGGTGKKHLTVADDDDPFLEIAIDEPCNDCHGQGYLDFHEGTISLIQRDQRWAVDRQARLLMYRNRQARERERLLAATQGSAA